MDAATVERFETERDRLAVLAYRLLGSAADAEDVVQDAFLRWQAADRDRIDVPAAWLTKVVTNLAVDRLRSAAARHERSVGSWLPEPLLGGDPMLGPAETAEQRESVTLAVLLLMERLGPVERAVYVLREAFSHSHAEVAEILDISVAASQQHAHRARRRVTVDRPGTEVDDAAAHRIVEAFLAAATSGSTERLLTMLTADVTAVSDGAGLAKRLLHYTVPERVATMVRAGVTPSAAKRRLVGGPASLYSAVVNGAPAMIAVAAGRVVGVVVLEVRPDGVAAVRGMAAPGRIARVDGRWGDRDHGAPIIADW